MPRPPRRRGPLSTWVIDVATGRDPGPTPVVLADDAFEDDFQFALYLAQEVHFSDVPGFLPDLDGDAALLGFRNRLEGAFLERLRDEVLAPRQTRDLRAEVRACVEGAARPALSLFVREHATMPFFYEVVKHRSAYQL